MTTRRLEGASAQGFRGSERAGSTSTLAPWRALLVALLLLPSVPTQAARQLFRTFTGEDGLSQMSVRSLAQDAEGYLWIGTESGLNRFDGRYFATFGVHDGLSDGMVTALAAGGEGRVWIGTLRGLDVLHNGRIERFGREHGSTYWHSPRTPWRVTENGPSRRAWTGT